MKKVLFLLFTIKSLIFPTQEIGLDSGLKSILLYQNSSESSSAIVIVGGIHGDEIETIDVVNHLIENLEAKISLYFIPSLNPTLSNIQVEGGKYRVQEGRRGYLESSLDKNGFVKPGEDLSKFSKDLYYRIFYGTDSTYKKGIKHYVDPNRDFYNERLPSTRAFKTFLNRELLSKHEKVVIISVHAYMVGGRIYPEYKIVNNKPEIEEEVRNIGTIFSKATNFIFKDFYEPALPIKERFIGELIHYTGLNRSLIAFDIELDRVKPRENKKRVLLGVEAIISYLDKK